MHTSGFMKLFLSYVLKMLEIELLNFKLYDERSSLRNVVLLFSKMFIAFW